MDVKGAGAPLGPRIMGRLTAELVLRSPQYMNPCGEYEIDLRANRIAAIENLGTTEVRLEGGRRGQQGRWHGNEMMAHCRTALRLHLASPRAGTRLQNQFDSIDLSDNAVVRLEGFPKLPRLKVLHLNNNRINRIARRLEGEPGRQAGPAHAAGPAQRPGRLACPRGGPGASREGCCWHAPVAHACRRAPAACRGAAQLGVADAHQQPVGKPVGEPRRLAQAAAAAGSALGGWRATPPLPVALQHLHAAPPTEARPNQRRCCTVQDLDPLQSLPRLRYLSLIDNPVTKTANYRFAGPHACREGRGHGAGSFRPQEGDLWA